jgi:uncharacterized protein (DUF427 family)
MDEPAEAAPLATENVWDYPRPPIWRRSERVVRIVFDDTVIAQTNWALQVLETSHPPVYYLPPDAFIPGTLRAAAGSSFCEWKGHARYWDICHGTACAERAGWSYPEPTPAFLALRDHVAVYAGRMQACYVGDEQVRPQPGAFYGGWITQELIGPFKGGPGSAGW